MTERGLLARTTSERSLRLAAIGVIAINCWVIGVSLLRIGAISPDSLPVAIAGTVAYLPFHVRHLWYRAIYRQRPPAGIGTLATMAAIILGILPIAGVQWLGTLYPLAMSALLVLRRPWAVGIFAALVVLPIPVTISFGEGDWAPYFFFVVLFNGAGIALLVWLIAAAGELREARAILADQAIVQERQRIDDELGATVGTALARVVEHGRHASARRDANDQAGIATDLRAMQHETRQALGLLRGLVGRYRDVSFRSELETAITLLRAGGIDARLATPAEDIPTSVSTSARASLHAEVNRLLRDSTARSCAVTVATEDGNTTVALR